MRNFKLLSALILINIINLNAQDYQTVKSDRIAFFNNQNDKIKCIRIDSVIFKTDSILYPFSNIQQIDYDCFSPFSYSWIGEKVMIQSNGCNLFFNKQNDTIKIKTNATLNESWIAYELMDSIRIIAKVINLDTLEFLGQRDSVKTIEFQVYDKQMTPLFHNLNDMSILISKNYGFVKMLNFSLFPNFENNYLNEQLEIFNLIGLTKPKIGIQNLTWFDVYDFQVGDELHILYESSDWVPNVGYSTACKTKLKYLERFESKDSIVYRVEREASTFRRIVKWDSTTYTIVHDTITNIYKPDSLFDKLPDEPIVSDFEAYANLMTSGINISKTKPSVYGVIWHSNDTCWQIPIADGCFPDLTYLKGLGGPYYSCTNAFSLGGEDNQLVYYKKGSSAWGTPLVITGVKNNELEEIISVYPNPATDYVFIKIKLQDIPCYFELSNIQGKLTMKNKLDLNESVININNIDNGIYIYRLLLGDKIIKTGKIIKINACR
jgi:hypothetical protein